MNAKVTFAGAKGLYNIPYLILSENEELNIEFDLPILENCVYIANITHGKSSKRITLTNKLKISIFANWFDLECKNPLTIDLSLRDTTGIAIYRQYYIEPLSIKKEENSVCAVAYIQDIETRLSIVETEMSALKEFIKIVPKLIETAKKEAVIESAGGDPMGA